jgi:TolB-like protein
MKKMICAYLLSIISIGGIYAENPKDILKGAKIIERKHSVIPDSEWYGLCSSNPVGGKVFVRADSQMPDLSQLKSNNGWPLESARRDVKNDVSREFSEYLWVNLSSSTSTSSIDRRIVMEWTSVFPDLNSLQLLSFKLEDEDYTIYETTIERKKYRVTEYRALYSMDESELKKINENIAQGKISVTMIRMTQEATGNGSVETSIEYFVKEAKPRLAILPFSGGSGNEGEDIARQLSYENTIKDTFIAIPRNSISQIIIQGEHGFQRNSGLTDPNGIFELGKQMNANYVVAGSITKLGNRNLIIVSILDMESLQRIAGTYKEYGKIEEVDSLLPLIAQNISKAHKDNNRPYQRIGLAVPRFIVSSNVDNRDAEVLSQILAAELTGSGKYAVFPRTGNLEKVMEEHRNQRSGLTDQQTVLKMDMGKNVRYVLSGSVSKIGSTNKFMVEILDIEDGVLISGAYKNYTTISDGIKLMPELAKALSRW